MKNINQQGVPNANQQPKQDYTIKNEFKNQVSLTCISLLISETQYKIILSFDQPV
jgi:hypothetical protein